LSIFTKDCPQCAETNAAYVVRCQCGFAFAADDGGESQTEEELALEEEKLYQEYLAARARQAGGTAAYATKSATAEPTDQAKIKAAEQAKAAAEHAQAELKIQTTRVIERTTERKPATVEPAAAPAIAQTADAESAPPAAKPPTATAPVQTTAPGGTTQTPAPKPSVKAKQSWLIPGAKSDAKSDAITQPAAAKPAVATPAKPATNTSHARPTPAATNVHGAKMSAAQRAKQLEQRLKEVQDKRDSNTTTMRANAASKIKTSAGAVKPNPDSARAAAAATSRPPTAPATTAPVKRPATPQVTTVAKTDDTSVPPPSKPTRAALDTKPDQPKTVAKTKPPKTQPPKPKKANGSDTAPAAGNTIPVPAAKEAVRSPSMTATAKADLEAALQALNTKTPETNPAIPTPTESGNGADQTDAVPEELLHSNAQARLAGLTQNSGLGCTEKECPNCTALVPMDADRCGCGFGFPTKEDVMPSLSLTESDVEALEKRSKSSSINHLR